MTVKELINELLDCGDMSKEVRISDFVPYFDGKLVIHSTAYEITSVEKDDPSTVSLYFDNYNHYNYGK